MDGRGKKRRREGVLENCGVERSERKSVKDSGKHGMEVWLGSVLRKLNSLCVYKRRRSVINIQYFVLYVYSYVSVVGILIY